jgi:hypothetical protein
MTIQLEPGNSELPHCWETAHFRLYFWPRNQPAGRGHGINGSWQTNLLQTYAEGLELLYAALTAPPWSRPPLDRVVEVLVLDPATLFLGDGGPFTTVSATGEPYIVLPCRSFEPTLALETGWALAVAVHEATHVFNCQLRHLLDDVMADHWAWFDEATALLAEQLLLPAQQDHFRFLGEWFAKPEIPLDDFNARYTAGQFVRYLAARFDLAFVNRVWLASLPAETPLAALTRLLPAGHTFLSAAPHISDVFASGYCLDSWFLNDPASAAYAPELYARYGERALSESFELQAGQSAETSDALDHLACRYYRFYLAGDVREIQLEITPAQAQAPLKAELVSVTKEQRRGVVTPLCPPDPTRPVLAARLAQARTAAVDHFILVVTNCGTRAAQIDPARPHDDQKWYALKLTTR